MNPESTFVDTFIVSDKKDRYKSLLAAKKRRSDILMRLYHSLDYEPRFAFKIPPGKQTSKDIHALLVAKGAPKNCYAISNIADIDGKELALDEALDMLVGTCIGTVLICIPDHLAYYEAEDLGYRFILQK